MAKKKEQTYRLLPEWVISQTNKSLFISGGADARFEIELERDERSFFSSLNSAKTFKRKDLSSSDQRVLEELITAEIVVPTLLNKEKIKIAVFGDNNQLNLDVQKDEKSADFLLIVRTKSTFTGLLEKIEYIKLTKPHLFIDMAYHHTFSIGPLVFPGETACIACLQGRISKRWGDETPPITPNIIKKYSNIVSELIKTELDRIRNGDTSLTNKTISWNFQDRMVKKDQLLKVPICPICTQYEIDHRGALALPWGKDESTTNTV